MIHLPANSVNTRQIKNGAVNAAKLHANSVNGSKVKNGSLSAADLSVAARAQFFEYRYELNLTLHGSGFMGSPSLHLPPGDFALEGSVRMRSGDTANDSSVNCVMSPSSQMSPNFVEAATFYLRHGDVLRVAPTSTLTMEGSVHLAVPATVQIVCTNNSGVLVGGDVYFTDWALSARRVVLMGQG